MMCEGPGKGKEWEIWQSELVFGLMVLQVGCATVGNTILELPLPQMSNIWW